MENFVLEFIKNNQLQTNHHLPSAEVNLAVKRISERENLCEYDSLKKYLEEIVKPFVGDIQSYCLSFTDNDGYYTVISKIQ